MAVLIGIETSAMMLLDRRADIVTTGIATVVVMVGYQSAGCLASAAPGLIDTVVGVGVGVACKWAASLLYFCFVGEPVR